MIVSSIEYGSRQSLCPLSFFNRNHFDNSSSILNLRSELLNSKRFIRCCIGIVLNGPFLTAQNSAIKRCPQRRRPHIIRQHVFLIEAYFLMVSKPDRITPQTLTRGHAIHTAPLFHQIIHRHKHLFTYHRQIPIDQIPSHS